MSLRFSTYALLTLGLLSLPANDVSRAPIYDRSMSGVVERAQADLRRDIVLWKDHSSWDDPWQAQSEHYAVRSTDSYFVAMDIARGLDGMLGHYQTVLQTDHVPDGPYQIRVFPDLPTYNTFGEEFGAEHSSFYGSFFAAGNPDRPVAVLTTSNPTTLRMWITHGAVHQFLTDAYPTSTPPAWVSEGLASYFTTYWAYSWCGSELERFESEGRALSLDRLLGEGLDQYGDDSDVRFIQLGMLFNYLLHKREDTLTGEGGSPFADWLRTVMAGRDASGLPVNALLTTERARLQQDFSSFSDW